jgi:transposase InsO family protein
VLKFLVLGCDDGDACFSSTRTMEIARGWGDLVYKRLRNIARSRRICRRRTAYDGFMHFYNHHRSHGALGWATPIETLARLHGDNLPAARN